MSGELEVKLSGSSDGLKRKIKYCYLHLLETIKVIPSDWDNSKVHTIVIDFTERKMSHELGSSWERICIANIKKVNIPIEYSPYEMPRSLTCLRFVDESYTRMLRFLEFFNLKESYYRPLLDYLLDLQGVVSDFHSRYLESSHYLYNNSMELIEECVSSSICNLEYRKNVGFSNRKFTSHWLDWSGLIIKIQAKRETLEVIERLGLCVDRSKEKNVSDLVEKIPDNVEIPSTLKNIIAKFPFCEKLTSGEIRKIFEKVLDSNPGKEEILNIYIVSTSLNYVNESGALAYKDFKKGLGFVLEGFQYTVSESDKVSTCQVIGKSIADEF